MSKQLAPEQVVTILNSLLEAEPALREAVRARVPISPETLSVVGYNGFHSGPTLTLLGLINHLLPKDAKGFGQIIAEIPRNPGVVTKDSVARFYTTADIENELTREYEGERRIYRGCMCECGAQATAHVEWANEDPRTTDGLYCCEGCVDKTVASRPEEKPESVARNLPVVDRPPFLCIC